MSSNHFIEFDHQGKLESPINDVLISDPPLKEEVHEDNNVHLDSYEREYRHHRLTITDIIEKEKVIEEVEEILEEVSNKSDRDEESMRKALHHELQSHDKRISEDVQGEREVDRMKDIYPYKYDNEYNLSGMNPRDRTISEDILLDEMNP